MSIQNLVLHRNVEWTKLTKKYLYNITSPFQNNKKKHTHSLSEYTNNKDI